MIQMLSGYTGTETAGTCRDSLGRLAAVTLERHRPENDRSRQIGPDQQFTIKEEEVKIMKEGIHPQFYQATVTCNCGNTFVTGSTKKEIHVEVCSKCHSFYTGQQKTAAARGRIERFNKKYGIESK